MKSSFYCLTYVQAILFKEYNERLNNLSDSDKNVGLAAHSYIVSFLFYVTSWKTS